ncbi:ATP-dependent DNA helicase q4 [Citrus sinensis]|uniref:ATP-dependent DNA helicase q4 n=1 Tax=Citrus sinensis TaxID=2711 RepID=A0ACB8LGX1_CITSI|nr:ATP-dependent DNA helicase q4 [Citrus sinensis]
METDSDSGGSHISATPPRCQNPPSPPPPQTNTLSSSNSKVRVNPSHLSETKKPTKSKPSQPAPPTPPPPPSDSTPLPTLPFQIRRSFSQNPSISAFNSLETLPAGFCSRLASFTKIQKPSLRFENDQSLPTPSNPQGINGIKSDAFAKKKKQINLVSVDVPLPPAKLRKCNGEGNFVRLNLNNNKRKFANKGKRNKSFRGKLSYRRSKKKLNKNETESKGAEDEYGLIIENLEQNQKNRRAAGELELVEDAVRAVKDEASNENLGRLLRLVYGYDSFRDGQLEAIKMVLDKKSTMLVLPTGAGKSLCYQIPAMILPGLTLVVCPLVALMIDQLRHLPPVIHGGFLSSSQRPEEVAETIRLIQVGAIKVLFVSPERFLNADFLSIFTATSFISLVVVDEAHCVSEWSHNFRPSYMRLRASLLRARLNVECILAMTATATTTTLRDVMSALEIPLSNLIQKAQLRDNLQLSVSLSDLLMLMKSSPFTEVQSIIIYCKFQFETDLISRYLCDNSISVKSYHSGIPAKDRSRIQELFCSNKIRVVVATVAFGMGLDKRDVGAVIHYSLPESLEEYVQEIGRAGRDGRLSYCHLFLDDITYFRLRSLMYRSETKQGQYVFDIPTVANSIGATTIDVSNQLLNLKMRGEITYELKDPAYCYTIVEVPSDFCALSAHLTKWLSEVENCKVRKLDRMFHAAVFAVDVCEKMHGCNGSLHTPCLQKNTLDYFRGDDNCDVPNKIGQSRGRYVQINFQVVMEAAKAELLNFAGKDVL